MAVVADSSPLIYLAALSDFHFLKELFGSVLIPPAVYREVVQQGHGFPVKGAVEAALGDWLSVRIIQDMRQVAEVSRAGRLHAGESEAIVLAQECHADRLLLDDQRGVRYARGVGIAVTRTPVIYGEAKLRGWIPNVQEKLDALPKLGFRLKDQDYRLVLAKVGEL
jgi:predicted nucleic acid-binding protein